MIGRVLPVAGVVAFCAVFFWPELGGGRLAVTGNMTQWLPWSLTATAEQKSAPSVSMDCNLSYYPRRALLHAAWRDGEIPYWNPYTFCGAPFLADPQCGVLYPPNWILLPLEPGVQMNWFLFLHVAWGALGVLALLRARGIAPHLALLAACAWALNGFFAKHFGQPTFVATMAWMPWVLHFSLRLLARPGLFDVGRLGLVGAMTFLAGQPQLALLAAYAAALVAGTTWAVEIPRRGGWSGSGRIAAAFGAAIALAFLLSAAQLLPTRELASRSARAELPWGTIVSGALHPVETLRLLVPELLGSPLTGDEWSTLFPRGDGFFLRNQMNSIFCGTPMILLALWGMIAPRTRRAAFPFAVLLAVALLWTFGSPLARLAYEVLPGFRFSRIDRAGSLVVLAAVVPAALGARDLSVARGRARALYGAGVIAAAAVGAAVALVRAAELPAMLGGDLAAVGGALRPEHAALVGSRVLIAAAFAALTGLVFLFRPWRGAPVIPLALACAQLWLFAAPYRMDRAPSEVFPPSQGLERLRALLESGHGGGGRLVRFGRDTALRAHPVSSVLPPSTNVPYGIRDLQGYNALCDAALGRALETAWGEPVFSHGIWTARRIVAPRNEAALSHPLLDALSVRAAAGGVPFRAAGWVPVPGAGFPLLQNPDALPRIRLAERGRGVSAAEMEDLLSRGALDPAQAVWVGEGLVPDGGEGEGAWDVQVVRDAWNDVWVRTRAPRSGVLVVADAGSPGWRATLDGEPAEVLSVYGLVRGVVVPQGEHLVRMRYRPEAFRWGVSLSLLGLALAGLALAFGREDAVPRASLLLGRAGAYGSRGPPGGPEGE